MVTYVVDTTIPDGGTRGFLGFNGDDLWVTRSGVMVHSDDRTPIQGTGSNHAVHIEGAVAAFMAWNSATMQLWTLATLS